MRDHQDLAFPKKQKQSPRSCFYSVRMFKIENQRKHKIKEHNHQLKPIKENNSDEISIYIICIIKNEMPDGLF